MKGLIVALGDRLQATFPPNRVAILLAGPIVAASAWISGVVASNVPGVELPKGVIAGVMGAAVLIVIRLLDRWFDQWQKGEPIHVDHDIDALIDELADGPEVKALLASLGTHEAVKNALADLHGRISEGSINEAEIAHSIEALHGVVAGFLAEHSDVADLAPEQQAQAPAPTPPAAAAAPLEHPPVAAPPGAPAGPPANVE